jgi:hypothetical protein
VIEFFCITHPNFYLNRRFGNWTTVRCQVENLLIWVQSVEIVPINGSTIGWAKQNGFCTWDWWQSSLRNIVLNRNRTIKDIQKVTNCKRLRDTSIILETYIWVRGAGFESRPGHWLSFFCVVFFFFFFCFCFTKFLPANTRILSGLDPDCFLPNPFQFVNRPIVPYSVDADSFVKYSPHWNIYSFSQYSVLIYRYKLTTLGFTSTILIFLYFTWILALFQPVALPFFWLNSLQVSVLLQSFILFVCFLIFHDVHLPEISVLCILCCFKKVYTHAVFRGEFS